MKTELQAIAAIGKAGSSRRFAIMLAVFLLLACVLARPKHYGDIQEYTLTTVALANHATPDIRLQDVAEARARLPEYAALYGAVEAGIKSGAGAPQAGVLRARDGYYAMHFFAYPALAAVPYTLLRAIHVDPFRCYQLVNSAAVLVLGLALFRLFGTARRATLGLLLYLVCGGMLYWQWSSPETFSATGLLAGLVLFCTGAPVAGGLLAGLGATQNPPLILFCAFAPLLRGVLAKGASINRREIAGLIACAVLALLPAAFDLVEFGTPSIIGELATDPSLVTAGRLHSFFFDLDQGVVLGIPALAMALLLWRGRDRHTLLACAFAVAMALPSLAATNWNSGSAGIMRYALWASMPLLFAFLWQLSLAPHWPRALVIAVLAGQALAMAHARSYTYIEFSPVAKLVMSVAPGWYNPEPEIFVERTEHRDAVGDPGKPFTWTAAGGVAKTLYDTHDQSAFNQLCGPGRNLSPTNRFADAGHGWRYINGPVRCD
jgi:hypothetical protein